MKLEQIYTGCLAQGAYFIENDGEAAVIDPLREVQPYLERAKKAGARIKYIFETHFHADFVSGHLELATATGATIVYGPTAETSFSAHIGKDGERFSVGKLEFELLHTPGHTLESACFLLRNDTGKEVALFTGDTLFIGDVGRPDLAQKKNKAMAKEDLAGLLYESLHQKIFPLSNDLIVYPAHGAGSACGKNMSKETSDTLGHQKLTNYAMRSGMTKEEFVKEVTEGLLPPPAYFPVNVELNRSGANPLKKVLTKGKTALSPGEFERVWEQQNALALDTRDASSFAQGFIPGSINIGLDGSFAPWVGSLIPFQQPIILIADEGREEEAITRLARIGYDDTIGYLEGGFQAWKEAQKQVDTVETISVAGFAERMKRQGDTAVIDVRREDEFRFAHLESATNVPLENINEGQQRLEKHERYYVHCAGGYRSMIFISILKARGYDRLVDIEGGFNALMKEGANLPIADSASIA